MRFNDKPFDIVKFHDNSHLTKCLRHYYKIDTREFRDFDTTTSPPQTSIASQNHKSLLSQNRQSANDEID